MDGPGCLKAPASYAGEVSIAGLDKQENAGRSTKSAQAATETSAAAVRYF